MPNRRSNLQKMAREKSRSAFDRARKAIQLLQEQRRPIDFKTVAQAGNVSLAYLYRNDELKNLIERLKAENEIIRELEGQVLTLTRENDRMMRRIALLSAGLSKW